MSKAESATLLAVCILLLVVLGLQSLNDVMRLINVRNYPALETLRLGIVFLHGHVPMRGVKQFQRLEIAITSL